MQQILIAKVEARKMLVVVQRVSFWILLTDTPRRFLVSMSEDGDEPLGSFEIGAWNSPREGEIIIRSRLGREEGYVTKSGQVYHGEITPTNCVGSFIFGGENEFLAGKYSEAVSEFPQRFLDRSLMRAIHASLYLFLIKES